LNSSRVTISGGITAEFPDGISQTSQGVYFKVVPSSNRDNDEDGFSDRWDNCIYSSNPDQRDTDNDGIGNLCDPDFDNNGTIDVADHAYLRFRIDTADQDADLNGDGIVDLFDEVILESSLNTRQDLPVVATSHCRAYGVQPQFSETPQ